jgi:hypothetical protein
LARILISTPIVQFSLFMEDKLRLSATLVRAISLSCGVVLAAPVAAYADNVAPPKHKVHAYRTAHSALPSSATAFAPEWIAPAMRRDDDSEGLTRNTDECNRGCIGN